MAPPTDQAVVALLLAALREPDERLRLIREVQEIVWNAPEELLDSWEWRILGDLAYDLEFYEPDENKRREDASYYGDERVEQEIRSALQKLKEGGLSFPET